MDANDRKLGTRERDFIRDKLMEGWAQRDIAKHLDVNHDTVVRAIKEFGLKKSISGDLIEKMRKSMLIREIFGKKCDETEKNIIDLLRKGVPPEIVGDFVGLRCDTADLEFYEKKKITFQDKCKQARAEPAIRTIIAAYANPKPTEALRLLSQSDITRSMYKTPKEQKEAIEINFSEFQRDTDIKEE